MFDQRPPGMVISLKVCKERHFLAVTAVETQGKGAVLPEDMLDGVVVTLANR